MWLRRRRDTVDTADLDRRFAALERRMDDLEDLAHAALAPDRVDDLATRLGELEAVAASREDVLDLRLQTARIAAHVAEATNDLRSELASARSGAD